MNKKEINNYYNDIYINLPCSHRIKKVFMKSFKSRVNEFIEDNPNVTISDLKDNFGETKEIIDSFEGQIDYYKKLAKKRLIVIIAIIIIAAIVIGVLIYTIFELIRNLGGDIVIKTY